MLPPALISPVEWSDTNVSSRLISRLARASAPVGVATPPAQGRWARRPLERAACSRGFRVAERCCTTRLQGITTKEAAVAAEVLLFDAWLDAIDDRVRARVRGSIEGMLEEEL